MTQHIVPAAVVHRQAGAQPTHDLCGGGVSAAAGGAAARLVTGEAAKVMPPACVMVPPGASAPAAQRLFVIGRAA
ncbi:MAG: hypothetical protein JXJ20_06175 [Anaerolineae bacterium]|nr:hypothetical protein [Anaerolineae bacterium]